MVIRRGCEKMTKIFFDTKFSGLHQYTSLISIGLVSECGRIFYAEFTDYDQLRHHIDNWIRDNVINNLVLKTEYPNGDVRGDRFTIKGDTRMVKYWLSVWLSGFKDVEMWSDYLAYDWVLFNELFGNEIPKNVNYIPFDICTMFKIENIDPDIERESFIDDLPNGTKHNALFDAEVIKACYNKLVQMQQ